MTYRLLIKQGTRWHEVGLNHHDVESARSEARTLWSGHTYLVLPVSL